MRTPVRLGLEVFLEKHLDLVRSKKVGLITNPTGTDRDLISSMDIFAQNPDIDLRALFSPEHGIRGDKQAGEYVPFHRDEKYGIPVFSLYGLTHQLSGEENMDGDERMRTFDTVMLGKTPDREMLQKVDVMVFDIQDIGTRVYTYLATMVNCMEICAENDLGFIVLDRPNPINGIDMEGPILDYPEFSTFVGLYPIPVRHAMTVGELALLFNSNFLKKKVELTVIPMEGWQRDLWFDDTTLSWIAPSPNIPTLTTATVYPGQVFLEGTNISEGRGTAKPFELLGAPWIDNSELTQRLVKLSLPGVRFRETFFTPTFSKYRGILCSGTQVHVADRKKYNPFLTVLQIIKAIRDLHWDKFVFYENYFDKIVGNSRIREGLESGLCVRELLKEFDSELSEFAERRKPFLLY
ncbi:MAG: DUF1343 domain-containing protein [Candidatus Aminicenantes bacterium]|nr:DUF1343 domain-containing protein [Candidatus Aminicenantes bacterium]